MLYTRHQESYPNKAHPTDYTGQQYGELTAAKSLNKTEKDGNSILWLLQCNCGRFIEAVPAKLKFRSNADRVTRCLECNPVKKLPRGQAARNETLRRYISKARRDGLEFFLSDSEVDILFSGNCFYCGSPPSNVQSEQHHKYNGPFIYSGIDRLDNEAGYTLENCVSCCIMCNKAKRDLPAEEFVSWIHRASNHLKSEEN